jgi:phenylalanyl-tRNA synthetase beta chain
MGVRRGRKGEKLLALDDVEYELGPEHLLITDGDDPVGIAGVIGGAPTAVHDDTTDLLIEAAAFNARSVRATRRSLNISTDASYRFERGSDREACADASDRAARLIVQLAGGEPGEWVDAYPVPFAARTVSIRRSNTRRLLGISLSLDEIAGLLERLSFEVSDRGEDSISVRVPSWRDDIVEEADLVEEVARLNGYDKIGQGWPFRTTVHGSPDPFQRLQDECADHLAARGHTELLGSAFVDTNRMAAMGFAAGDPRANPVKVLNPLTSLHGNLRTTLLPGVLDAIRRNIDYGTREIQVFESGTVFLPGANGGLPVEPLHLLVARSRPGGTSFWNSSKQPTQLFDIKREVEVLAAAVRIPLAGLDYRFEAESGRFSWDLRGRQLIEGGIISARMAELWGIDQPVWYAEMNLTALWALREARQGFKPLPEYPSSRRDLSLVLPAGVAFGDLEKALARSGGRLLESSQVFDVYEGGSLPEGSTAIGVRLTFRSHEGTLTDADVDAVVEKIVRKLESEFSVRLRS